MTLLFKSGSRFHQDIKWVAVLAQIFGLFPVKGVTSEKCEDLVFTWRSKRVIFSIAVIVGSSFATLMSFCEIYFMGFSLQSFNSFIFNANSVIGGVIFFKLAKNWPKLMQKWSHVESSLERRSDSRLLQLKLYVVVVTVVTAAAVEHVLSIVHECSEIAIDEPDKAQAYFLRAYPHLFDFFEYSMPLAIFAVAINFCNVFSWNFLDVFLMIISMELSHKFRQISARVTQANRTKVHLRQHWGKIREDYNKILILCKAVNEDIATLIVVSFATNMFFITSQLFWSLTHRSTTIESVYFSFSFGLLLSRTLAVILFASAINDESKRSMNSLLTLSSDAYNSEVERFAFQIHCQPAALTGSDFFTITRGLLFGMAGSIVTYELFLIQSK